MTRFYEIEKIFGKGCLTDSPISSRVHYIKCGNTQVGIKREDELSCTISGSKYRKYQSLIPYLNNEKVNYVVCEGSEYSNNILGLSQVLNELDLPYHFFLKRGYSDKAVNSKLLDILTDKSQKTILTAQQWKTKETLAQEFIAKLPESQNSLYLPEGANHISCLPGAMTVAFDIKIEEFDNIFIDAGTGFSAIALILGLSYRGYKGCVHIISLFEEKSYFKNLLEEYRVGLQKRGNGPEVIVNYTVHEIASSKDFGKSAKTTIENIKQLARKYGIISDPLYSGRSIPYALEYITQNKTKSPLIIHSGGALALSGYL